MSDHPVLLHTAIDARDCRGLAEFYRRLLGLRYREGEEPPTDGSPDDADWLVLLDDAGNRVVTIQEKLDTVAPTWPSEEVPMQMHMNFKVPTVEDLKRHREHAEELGRGCCMTGPRMRASPSSCWPTRPGIPSVCWSSSAAAAPGHGAAGLDCHGTRRRR